LGKDDAMQFGKISKKRIFVTGGAGFIGSHLLSAF
jgi:nucleoside-diphosphate-sugar epimerase